MDRYLVFGHPVRHSKSPFIHTLFARQTQQELEYGLAEPAVKEFATSLRDFFAQGGKGCNVTVPFKEQAFALVDRLSPRARRAGAVNTIKLTDDGVLLGDNTDGAGLVADLKAHGVALAGSRILLLGAGGAARGALARCWPSNPRHWLSPTVLTPGRSSWLPSFVIWGQSVPRLMNSWAAISI